MFKKTDPAAKTSLTFGKKAKKSVNALVISSTALASLGLPSIFNAISTLQPAKINDKKASTSRPNSAPASAGHANTRSQSMYLLETRTVTATGPHELGSALRDSNRENIPRPTHVASMVSQKAQPEVKHEVVEDEDWDAEFGVSTTPSVPTLKIAAPATLAVPTAQIQQRRGPHQPPVQSRRPINNKNSLLYPRRIQSAPSVAQRRLGDELGIGADVDDALLEFPDDAEVEEFVVPSVKAKVTRQHEKKLEKSVSADGGLESWDDDFNAPDEGSASGGLSIPQELERLQMTLKSDSTNIRKFALHIEDMKYILLDVVDMAKGLANDYYSSVDSLNRKYARDLERAQVLMDLGEFSDDKADRMVSDDKHIRILSDLLNGVCYQENGTADPKSNNIINGTMKGNHTPESSSSETLCELRDIASKFGKLQFGVELMPSLVISVTAVKQRLVEYKQELRQLTLNS